MANYLLRATIDLDVAEAVQELAKTEQRKESNMVQVLLTEALGARKAKKAKANA